MGEVHAKTLIEVINPVQVIWGASNLMNAKQQLRSAVARFAFPNPNNIHSLSHPLRPPLALIDDNFPSSELP